MAYELSGMADNDCIAPLLIGLIWGKHIADTKTNILRHGLSFSLCDGNCHTMQPAPRKTFSEASLYCGNFVCGGVWHSVESGLGWRGGIHIQLSWTVNRIPQKTQEREAPEKSRWGRKDKKPKVAMLFMVACSCLRFLSLIFVLLSFIT